MIKKHCKHMVSGIMCNYSKCKICTLEEVTYRGLTLLCHVQGSDTSVSRSKALEK